MPTNTLGLEPLTDEATGSDPFDLDIRVIESSDQAATLIELTDDGCGSTCPNACVTRAC
jgi:FxLD family lantipeptide